MKKSALICIALFLFGSVPFAVSAAIEGPVSCNKNTASPASAGSQTPLGGPYVPVADYAVELNTGLLVYKECVLREMVTTIRKARLTQLDNQVLTQFNSGQGGNPLFGGFPSRELGKEESLVSIRTVDIYLNKNDSLSGFNNAVRDKVKNAIGIGYTNARDPRRLFTCPYTGNLEAIYSGSPSGNFWDAFNAVTDYPGCSVLRASELGVIAVARQDAYELYKNRQRLDWGDGIYDLAHYDEDGFRITDTSGKFVGATAENSILSGYIQTREADDINEMTEPLYAAVASQVLSPGAGGTGGTNGGGSMGGLAAITSALSGALSYMNALVQSSGGTVIQQGNDIAGGTIAAAGVIEKQYYDAIQANIDVFTNGGNALKAAETACYDKIAQAVCQSGTRSGNTCTATTGATLNISTQTIFSGAVTAPWTNTAGPLTTNLKESDDKLKAIAALIVKLTTKVVTADQAQAELTNTIKPHTSTDVQSAQSAKSGYQATVANDSNTATAAWNSGWCNTNDQTNKNNWIACWSSNASACPHP
jgi:hypothetical protein